MLRRRETGFLAIAKKVTNGPQLYSCILRMAQLVDEKIQESISSKANEDKTFSLDDFSLTEGADGSMWLELSLVPSNKEIKTSLRYAFYQVAVEVVDRININPQHFKNALQAVLLQNLAEYVLQDNLSIAQRLEYSFKKQKEVLSNDQKKEFYKEACKLMRELYQSYENLTGANKEISRKIKAHGELVPINLEEEFENARKHSDPTVRFDNVRKLVRVQKVVLPRRKRIINADFFQQVEDLKKNLADLLCQNIRKSYKHNLRKYQDELQQFCSDYLTLPMLENIQYKLASMHDYFMTLVNGVSNKKNVTQELLLVEVTILLIVEQVQGLLESLAIASHEDSIGLDNNLIRRIDYLAETDLLSATEKELYLKYIIYSTIENWIDPRQRYEGDVFPEKNADKNIFIKIFYQDIELLIGMVAMLGARNFVEAGIVSELIQYFSCAFSKERCINDLKAKYSQMARALLPSKVPIEVTRKYQQVLEGFVAQPVADDAPVLFEATQDELRIAALSIYVDRLVYDAVLKVLNHHAEQRQLKDNRSSVGLGSPSGLLATGVFKVGVSASELDSVCAQGAGFNVST